ncbi:MAG: Uncharacterized protein G01um101416_1219 [Microgenomates group bacterium Gr01-1014_16]|nr:MAG: Uncharacterized protein G01um101416_1219 [Microgenomates group bacterium Gr01-1014_16]
MSSDEYKQYLKTIADRNITSPNQVDSFVKEAVGKLPVSRTRIIAGEANEVYDIETIDGKVVVRIDRSGNSRFEAEQWAIDQCDRKDIPVPRVLLIKKFQEGDKTYTACVQQRLPGDVMERGKTNYWEMPDDQVRRLFLQAGELLARMHSISIEGFDNIDSQGKGKYSAFPEMMGEHPRQRGGFLKMAQDLGVPESDFVRALEIVESESQRFTMVRPVLNHGDFGGKHIMYQDNQVTGIIDFGEVAGHSAIFDLARWEYWFGDNKYFDWIKEGYSDKSVFGDGYEEMSRLIRLNLTLGTAWWYYKDNYQPGIKRAMEKMSELLEQYG